MIFPNWVEEVFDLAPAFLVIAALLTACWLSLRPAR
jgi:hypothetical protein